jgi:hypothetical protein
MLLLIKKRISSKVIVILLLTGLLVCFINLDVNQTIKVAGQQAEPNIFEGDVPVRGVYLLSDDKTAWWDDNGDGAKEEHHIENPLIVNLAAAGFKPGDLVFISQRGKINYTTIGNWPIAINPNLLGVFSSSNTLLLDRSQGGQVGPLHRVPDAIDAGIDVVTADTYYGKVSTDIPEDFGIEGSGISIRIPSGAAYLLVAVADPWVADNDGWIKVTVEKDSDGDGLWDSWETKGIDADKDGTIDLKLPGADWQHKDIYVEVDYMQGHKPNQAALDDVVAAFRNCPDTVEYGPINLHIEVDDSTPGLHADYVRFDDAKNFKSKFGFGTYDQQHSDNSKAILEAKRQA